MKNLFNDISKEERQRILEMHENATKRNYLTEQGTVPAPATAPTPATGGVSSTNTVAKTIANYGPSNPEIQKKFYTINVSNNDFPKLYELFDPGKKWASNNNTASPFVQIITESLKYYSDKGVTPDKVKFSSVVNSSVVPKSKEFYILDGKKTNETNYQRLFVKPTNPNGFNAYTTAVGGIDKAFISFFNYKLQYS